MTQGQPSRHDFAYRPGHGTRTHDAHILLNVGLTQADLATAVGASSNSVETALHTLRQTGKLTTGYAQITLHELPTEDELDKSFCDTDTTLPS